MKKLSFIFLIVQLLLIELISQNCITPVDWTITKDTLDNFYKQHDLFFASEYVGYTTGVRGTMRKTKDSGETWDILHDFEGMGTSVLMRTLYFVDEQIGFASGDGENDPSNNIDTDAEFLRTVDGGITWEKNFVDSINRVTDLKFFDAHHGLAVCSANNNTDPIGRTFDSGKTWTFLDIKITRADEGKFILAGSRVLLYGTDKLDFTKNILFEIKEDGTIDYSLTSPPEKSRFYFYDEHIGFARTTERGYKTIDGGFTWTEIDFPKINLWSIVHFADTNNGVVANTIYEEWLPVGLEIYATKNGGETWERYESSDLCAIEGRLSYSAKKGEIHFHAGIFNGILRFDSINQVENKSQKVKIYPNPVGDFINLTHLENSKFNAQIYNLAGQKLYTGEATSRIRTDILPEGYYILKLFSDDKNYSFPFIKQ